MVLLVEYKEWMQGVCLRPKAAANNGETSYADSTMD